MNPTRITLFMTKPEALLIVASPDTSVSLPPVMSPFSKESLQQTALEHGVDLRVTVEAGPGKMREAIERRMRDVACAEQQQSRQKAAEVALLMRSSNIAEERDRAELVQSKLEVDERLRDAKRRLLEAKADLATKGKYMERHKYQRLVESIDTLKQTSLGIQARLGRLRESQKQERGAEFAQRFVNMAHEVLEPEIFNSIMNMVQEDMEP
jgi:hypothetical protein